jgi:hypothetical protein
MLISRKRSGVIGPPTLSVRVLTFSYIVLAALAFASVIIYQNTGLKAHFFHESAYPLLYAEVNLKTNSLFSPFFVGREISPVSWPAVGSLILSVFDGQVSLTAHVVYAATFSVAFLLVGLAYTRVMKFRILSSAIFIALLFTTFNFPPTRYRMLDQVWVWPMNSYGVQDLFSLMCAILIFKVVGTSLIPNGTNSRAWFLLTSLVFGSLGFNGVRGLLIVSGGLIVGLLVDIYIQWRRGASSPPIAKKLLLSIILGSTIGAMVTLLLFRGVSQPFVESRLVGTLPNPSQIVERSISYLWSWFDLFGAVPDLTESLLIPHNGFAGLKFIIVLFVSAISVYKLVVVRNSDHFLERVLTYRMGYLFLVTFAAALLTSTAGTSRYLIPLAFGIIFLVPFWIDKLLEDSSKTILWIAASSILPLVLVSSFSLTQYSQDDYKKTELYQLGVFLDEAELKHGFFAPWHSDALVINHFTEGRVRLQPIDVSVFGLNQHVHSDSLHFLDGEQGETSFLLLKTEEASKSEYLEALIASANESQAWRGWTIAVFPRARLLSEIRTVG